MRKKPSNSNKERILQYIQNNPIDSEIVTFDTTLRNKNSIILIGRAKLNKFARSYRLIMCYQGKELQDTLLDAHPISST